MNIDFTNANTVIDTDTDIKIENYQINIQISDPK